ncbi:DsbC family protein [Candidatus Deferrimicrobium sp.]|jgi:thiol:disulfide interchange protein DsbC|uniref:DsbC family protein n=1 Tax=Candidatus Deferrimicrobium sp. TaxID=3060586 RepID=UPI002EDAD9A9
MKPFLSACALAAFLALILSAPAWAFQKETGAAKECSECHKLTKEEAGKVLGKVVDNVVGVVQGPFPGLWEVDVARDGRIYPLYLDYSLKHLINGQVIRLSDMANLTGERHTDLNRVDVASLPVKGAIRVGSKAAKRTVIVLSDPTCPYCVKLHGEIKKAAAKDADVAFLVMPYPRNGKDKATYAKCLAVVCSKSEKVLDDAFTGKELPAAACKSDAVDETMKLADRLKIQGTPTMILPDGRMISGFMGADALLALIK